jgi:DNA-binding MarR family transcriptional regulator
MRGKRAAQRSEISAEAVLKMKRILLTFRSRVDDQYRPRGITMAQLQVLFAVKDEPGSSAAHLARTCRITPQTAQMLLKHLGESEFIVRGKDERNSRLVTATLTKKGQRLAEEIRKSALPLQQVLWRGISDEELRQLNDTLARCLSNLETSA